MKIVKLVSIIILSFCATVGYSQKVAKQEAKKVIKEIPLSHPYSKEYVDECIKEMLETGDSYCYKIYFLHSKQNMLYDLLMADKYNNPWACYEVYHNIAKELGEEYKYIISKELWNLAFYYLKKGADLNDENCISELVRIYEKGNTYVAADSLKADYYREKEKNNNGSAKVIVW